VCGAYGRSRRAELLGVPAVLAALHPMWVPTGQFPNPALTSILPMAAAAKVLNRATYASRKPSFPGLAESWRRHPQLTPDALAAAIHHALTNRSMATRAQQLSEQVRSENGLARAIQILESLR
jgi:hypothetical protein